MELNEQNLLEALNGEFVTQKEFNGTMCPCLVVYNPKRVGDSKGITRYDHVLQCMRDGSMINVPRMITISKYFNYYWAAYLLDWTLLKRMLEEESKQFNLAAFTLLFKEFDKALATLKDEPTIGFIKAGSHVAIEPVDAEEVKPITKRDKTINKDELLADLLGMFS